jgi:hypothetical protein
MSATSKRPAASSELRDWKVWAIVAGTAVALGHALLERVGWWALLLLLPLAGLAAAGTWMWLRRRPTGFAAEATQALAAHLPDGGRPPRVVRSQSDGHAHEIEWRLRHRTHGPALLKKARDLEHELGAALQLHLDKDRLRLRAGTADIPDLVAYEDFYRHPEPAGELVFGVGMSRWGAVWADLVAELVNPFETVDIGNRRATLRLRGRGPGEGVSEAVSVAGRTSRVVVTPRAPGHRRTGRR